MPAQKRRLASPSPKPRDNVAASSAAAGGGVGEGAGGGCPPLPSAPSSKLRRSADRKPERVDVDGELDPQRRDISSSRDMHVALYVSDWIWLRGSGASMCLADSDAEGGSLDGDCDSSQSDDGGNDEWAFPPSSLCPDPSSLVDLL
jgi:hypothetical protein